MKSPISLHRTTLATIAVAGCITLLIAHWQSGKIVMQNAHDGRINPWGGLPGCAFVGTGAASLAYWPTTAGAQIACQKDALGRTASVLPIEGIPPDMLDVLTSLQPWLAAPPFSNETRGHVMVITAQGPLPRGDDVDLGLDPLAQTTGQAVVACMAGRHADCDRAGIDPSRWATMLEGAAFRMAGMIQIDLTSGKLDMIASGHSPCFATFHRGNGARDPACLNLPPQIVASSRRISNHAIYGEAMPASIIKPVLALALLRASRAEGDPLDEKWLAQVLMESDTPALIDRLLCKDRQFYRDCRRVAYLEQAAIDLGYSSGKYGMLLGYTTDALMVNSPRLFRKLAAARDGNGNARGLRWGPMSLGQPTNTRLLQRCSDAGWSSCDGEQIADLVKEFWGQGDSIATPIGIGNMLLKLGAAANGDKVAYSPHLLVGVRSGAVQLNPAPPSAVAVSQADAVAILDGLQLTHHPRRAGQLHDGTAFSACLAVFATADACSHINWIAGKTGTPVFRHEKYTHQQRVAHCDAVASALKEPGAEQGSRQMAKLVAENAQCRMSPYKWYVALTKSVPGPGARWDKAIITVVERNYRGDVIDSQYDSGSPNIAAELVMRYLQAMRGSPDYTKEAHHE